MSERTRSMLVGLTAIVAVGGLATLLLLFGEFDELLVPRYAVTINTEHATGLRRGSSVELNGVRIGVIDDVTVSENLDYPVRIVAFIDRHIELPANAAPYAVTSLLGASANLEFVAPPTGNGVGAFPRDGSASIDAPIRIRMIEEITRELDARMAPVVETLASFRELSEQLTDLLAPTGVDDPESLRTTVRRVNELLDETREAMILAREWLGDEQLRADVRSAVAKSTTLIDEGTEALRAITEAAGGLQADGHELAQHLLPVADELSATLGDVRRLVALAADGDGTVGRLLNDPTLHESLIDAVQRLDVALKDIRLLVQKLRAEGILGF